MKYTIALVTSLMLACAGGSSVVNAAPLKGSETEARRRPESIPSKPHEESNRRLLETLPEVWDRNLNPRPIPSSIRAIPLDSGDVVLEWKGAKAPALTIRRTYFGNQRATLLDENKQTGQLSFRLDDGQIDHGTPIRVAAVNFKDGSSISIETYSYWDCWRGPDNRGFVKRIRGTDTADAIWWKYAFELLDKPEIFSAGLSGRCPEGSFPRLVARTRPIVGSLIPLKDETFLMLDEMGIVLRFDSEMRSKSALIDRRVFVLDGDIPGSGAMLERFTHKSYYPEVPPARYQEALDDLYEYLSQQRRKNK
jgi:hypothetical protein